MANRNPVTESIFSATGLLCRDEQATEDAGAALAKALDPGSTLSLDGPLGAGKTCFVRGLAGAMGEDTGCVSSPTFTIVHEYAGGKVVHLDLYRIETASELETLGFDDYLDSPSVVVIEWGGKFPSALPHDVIRLTFSIEGDARRIRGERPA